MGILYRDVAIPTGGLLRSAAIPPVIDGRGLRVVSDSPLQYELYLLSDRRLSGPYRSGDHAEDTNVTRLGRLFGCTETLAVGVFTGVWTFPEQRMELTPILVTIPDGQQSSVHLRAVCELSVRVRDGRGLVEDYLAGIVPEGVGELAVGTFLDRIRCRSAQMATNLFAMDGAQALAHLGTAAQQTADLVREDLAAEFPWLETVFCRLELSCTNESEVLERMNTAWADAHDFRIRQSQLLLRVMETVYTREALSAPLARIIGDCIRNNPGQPLESYVRLAEQLKSLETRYGTEQVTSVYRRVAPALLPMGMGKEPV